MAAKVAVYLGRLEGSAFVCRRARSYHQGEHHSSIRSPDVALNSSLLYQISLKFKDDVEHMTNAFD